MLDFSTCVTFNNGKKIPMLGLGVWNMKEKTYDAVRWALDAGYRHLDCASVYGNEADVGRAVKDSGIPREELFITSKLFSGDVRSGDVDGGIQGSLERLGTDYLDLYLIHWPIADKYVPAWRKMEAWAEKGVLRSIGLSNFHPHHYQDIMAEAKIKPVCVQLETHPYLAQKENLAFYQKENVALEAWSPLGRKDALENETLKSIAAKYGKSVAQLCIRWVLQHGVLPLPKSVTPSRILENTKVFDFTIDAADMQAIDALKNIGGQCALPDEVDF